MCLQVVDIAGGQTGPFQRLGDDPLLCHAIGHRQATRRAVLVDRAAADDRPDPVTVADGVVEALDDDDTTALTADVAVGRGVERLAFPVRGEHPGLREGDHGGRAQQHIGAAGQGQVAFPELQRLAGLMDGDQRRAARGVDGDRRPVQSQPVADPAGAGGTRGADGQVGLDLRVGQLRGRHAQVVVGGQPDEDAGLGVGQSGWRGAGMLDGAPGRFQQQPVLGVHQPGLARGHAEERRVEPGGVVDETGPPGDDLAGSTGILVEELLDVPPVLRDLGDGVAAVTQHIPVLVGVGGTGKSCGIADDGETGRLGVGLVARAFRS